MSRIGKKPIDIPHGVDVKIAQDVITVRGPKGELSYAMPESIGISVAEGKIVVNRAADGKVVRALHGLSRSLVSNMVHGVSNGYTRVLEIVGIGYRAQVKGNKLSFALGYSHPIEFELPDGIKAAVDDKQTTITLTGINKQLVGQTAANIKELRFPDSYKGKGIRYSGERIKLKAGKTGKK